MAVSWALISGASTGIGRATALGLLSKGFNVIAGVRSLALPIALLAKPQILKRVTSRRQPSM